MTVLINYEGSHLDGSRFDSLDDLPILGKEGEPIEGDNLDELIRRQVHPGSSVRKRVALAAYDVYRTCYEAHVLDGIRLQQNNETIRRDMRRFLTKVRNDARDVTEQVAMVWENTVDRHVVGESNEEDEGATLAVRKYAKQASLDTVSAMVNHLAWLQGPQYVVPVVRGKGARRGLRADIISPHIYDIVQDEDDPLGDAVGLAWHIHRRRVSPIAVEDDVLVLDAVSLRRFRIRTGSNGEVSDQPRVLVNDPIVHNYGRLPAALLRFTKPIAGDDWFLCNTNSRLVTGTIEIGVKMARMGLVRRAQCHQLLTIVGQIADMPKGQSATGDPEGKVVIPTRTGTAAVGVGLHDYDTDPKNFITEILFHVQCMVEPLGGHIQVDSGQPEVFGKVEIPHETQVEHRDRQVPPCTDYERDFWAAATNAVQVAKLDGFIDLGPPEEVRDDIRVDFGALTRALKDPEKAAAAEDWKLSRGQTSEIEIMRVRLGNVSREEARKVIEQNMEDRGWFNDLASRKLLKTGEDGAQTTAEAMGAMGTPAREENRDEQGESNGGAGGPAAEEPT